MVRALACHARGREFEPRRSRHYKKPPYVAFLLFMNRHPELDSGSIQSYIITIGIDRFRVKHGMTKYPPLKKSPNGLFFMFILSG